ncbi:MAG: hypothetical protein AAGA48_37370, partial [Myxococcota bacterium]
MAIRLSILALCALSCLERSFVDDASSPEDLDPQDFDGLCITDRRVQVVQDEADILFVVDNSCSMLNDQKALGDNFPRFIEAIDGSGLDFHVGVVTTDTDAATQAGRLRAVNGVRYLTPSTPYLESLFAQMVRVGTDGSSVERGLHAT